MLKYFKNDAERISVLKGTRDMVRLLIALTFLTMIFITWLLIIK